MTATPPIPRAAFDPIVCVVDFHHARYVSMRWQLKPQQWRRKSPQLTVFCRGPEVETWIGVKEGDDPATDNDWSSILPFLALADGAHS